MSEDSRETTAGEPQPGRRKSGPKPVAPGTEKDRLAAALRENLKRRKIQLVARRDETAPK